MLFFDLIASVLSEIDKSGSVSATRARLQRLQQTLSRTVAPVDRFGPRRSRGRGFYDDLVADMLAVVRSAGSREALLTLAMERLSGEHEDRVGLGYLLLSKTPSAAAAGPLDVTLVQAAGFSPERLIHLTGKAANPLGSSPLVQSLLVERASIDFTPLRLVRGTLYHGEFDQLTDLGDRVWLAAVALPALDARQPNRALVGLFPATGDPDQPSVPRGAAQEWRALEFLRIAYDLLNHQLAGTEAQREAQRRDLLADLTPGIVNHEINQQVGILLTGSHEMNLALRELPAELAGHPAVGRLVAVLLRQYGVLDRLNRIASAFNNLGKREDRSTVAVAALVADASILLEYRTARHGVTYQAEVTPPDLAVETDVALVEHVLLNLMINAMDVFEAQPAEPSGQRAPRLLRVEAAAAERDGIGMTVLNNGPPVPVALRERIFERGISTKPRGKGHGLGLFICRLVTAYVGGTVTLLPDAALPPGYTVGFRIWLPRVAPLISALADESPIAERNASYKTFWPNANDGF